MTICHPALYHRDTVSVCHEMVSTAICFRKVLDYLFAFSLQVVIQENKIYSYECNIFFHLIASVRHNSFKTILA